MRTCILLIAALWLGVAPARADQVPSGARQQLRLFMQSHDRSDLVDVTGTDLVSAYIFERVLESQRPDRIDLGGVRQDLQLGSLSSRSASTSVLARPGAAEILSAALESGAVSRKTDDKSATFSVNALPIRQLLSGQVPRGCGSVDEECRRGSGRWLRGLSASVSFNTSSATTPIPAGGAGVDTGLGGFLVGSRTLQALSARYELFVRERDHEVAQKALDAARESLQEQAASFLSKQESFEIHLDALLTQAGWRAGTILMLEQNADSLERLEAVLLDRYRIAYEVVRGDPDLQALQAATLPQKLAYISAQNKLLAEKLYRKALTVDYVQERPSDQPRLHELRLVVSTPLGRKPGETRLAESAKASVPTATLTVNGGLSLAQAGVVGGDSSKLRDAQVSAGLDWSPAAWATVRPTYTLAYYFQYMIANGVIQFDGNAVTPGGAAIPLPIPAMEVLDTKGPIHVVQFRVSIPASEGVTFPAAISYSSRTELITGRSFWQGHVGVSYDFSRLKQLLRRNQ